MKIKVKVTFTKNRGPKLFLIRYTWMILNSKNSLWKSDFGTFLTDCHSLYIQILLFRTHHQKIPQWCLGTYRLQGKGRNHGFLGIDSLTKPKYVVGELILIIKVRKYKINIPIWDELNITILSIDNKQFKMQEIQQLNTSPFVQNNFEFTMQKNHNNSE